MGAIEIIFDMVTAPKTRAVPYHDLQFDLIMMSHMQPVETLRLIVAESGRGRCSSLHDERCPSVLYHFSSRFGISAMKVSRQCDVDARLTHGLDGISMSADRLTQFASFADRHREQRVVGYQNARFAGRDSGKAIMDDAHLAVIDPAILDRKRTRGVYAENRHFIIFEPGAEVIADIALVTIERRTETADDVVERDVMISRDREHGKTRCLQSIDVSGGLLELRNTGALGKIPADDHEVGPTFLNPRLRSRNDLWIVGAKMEVGQMSNAGHRTRKRPGAQAVSIDKISSAAKFTLT